MTLMNAWESPSIKLTRPVPFREIPHRHDFYHLFWVESGNGTFVSDGRSYPVTRGSPIFVPPGSSSRLGMERGVERLCFML
jgi:mannose-6-phosphate isomerase-like protein (cupin superfamily)